MNNQTSPVYSINHYLPGKNEYVFVDKCSSARAKNWDSHLKAIKEYCKSQATIYDNTTIKGGTLYHKANNCNSWDCEECRQKKAYRLKSRIKAGIAKQSWRLLTLTYDPGTISLQDSLDSCSQHWDVFLKRLKRKFPQLSWIKVLEFQASGYPHFHVILNSYISHAYLKAMWFDITGASIVDIRAIKGKYIAYYVSNYLCHKEKKHHERDYQFYCNSLRRFSVSRNFGLRPWKKTTVVFTRGIDFDCSSDLWNDVIRLVYSDGAFFAVVKKNKIKYLNLFTGLDKFKEC